eukprot:m.38787 g.38787  ORF g.38787 m.38787 type:complete len:334 (-) comp12617_c0_seq1:74-1075(-)
MNQLGIAANMVSFALPAQLSSVVWMAAAILFTGSHSFLLNLAKDEAGKLPFNSSAVVTLQEAGKLLVCMLLLPSFKSLHLRDFAYAVPALCYAFNNNVAIVLQSEMDSATFQILCNFKTVTTCIFMFLLLQRQYPWQQWLAVVLIFLAGIINSSSGLSHADDGWQSKQSFVTPRGLWLMLVYCSSSGFAGVYSEWVMKKYQSESLWFQGLKMNLFGTVINGIAFLWSQPATDITRGFSPLTWLIIASQAANGMLYAAILKKMSNIARLLVVGAAMILAALLAQAGLHVRLSWAVWVACVLIMAAYALYYSPRHQPSSSRQQSSSLKQRKELVV